MEAVLTRSPGRSSVDPVDSDQIDHSVEINLDKAATEQRFVASRALDCEHRWRHRKLCRISAFVEVVRRFSEVRDHAALGVVRHSAERPEGVRLELAHFLDEIDPASVRFSAEQ